MSGKILSQIEELNHRLEVVEKIEEHLAELIKRQEKEILAEERDIKSIQKIESRIEKEEHKIEEEEKKIERAIVRLGNFTIKRSHLMEVARGAAGAFLGVGLGQALGGSVNLAKTLPWTNTIGILCFILIMVSILIYKNDKDAINKTHSQALVYVGKKLLFLYTISLVVQLLGLILFNNFPGWNDQLIKALIIGSYSAMSSAVAFTLI